MKHYLAQVGDGILVGKVGGVETVIANVKTLTDSTVSLSNSMEEVRAGAGAKLYGRFSHTSGITVQLTEAMFNMEYIALQVGSEVENGASVIFTEEITAEEDGTFELSQKPVSIGESCGLEKVIVWFREKGCKANDEYFSKVFNDEKTASQTITDRHIKNGHTYCVSYFTFKSRAQKVVVGANFFPAECTLLLTARLFAADSNSQETGKPAGKVQFKFPRFQLDGAFDLSLAMSSQATVSLNGTILAVDSGDCEDEGVYAEVVQVLGEGKFSEGLEEIAFEGFDPEISYPASDFPVGKELAVYAFYNNGLPVEVPVANLNFNMGTTKAQVKDGKITVAPTATGTIQAGLTGTLDGENLSTLEDSSGTLFAASVSVTVDSTPTGSTGD